MVKLTDASFNYKNKIIFDKLNIEIKQGLTCIYGDSGSGKTTILNIIANLQKLTSGTISIDNSNYPKALSRHANSFYHLKLSYCSQFNILLEEKTVLENVMYYNKDEIKAKELLEQLEMLSLKDTKVKNLSGGQKHRTAIARTLQKEATMYLFDEPLTGLDENLKHKVAKMIALMASEKICIVTSHDKIFEPNLEINMNELKNEY